MTSTAHVHTGLSVNEQRSEGEDIGELQYSHHGVLVLVYTSFQVM